MTDREFRSDSLLIETVDLRKSFGSLEVLKGINEKIYKGEVVVVIGPSGSGKSTFLRCLNRLEEPTGGQIIFEGTDITHPKTDINKLRQKMGMVFQQFNLFNNLSVMDNILIGPTKVKGVPAEQAKATATRLLERVGLLDKASAFPSQLSGGQKQR
ncbi:MAG: amino acid ABC transporter ATP-binding protein, partial [Clostridia bacterium]|nr:amino acid ABC transporter ATP-binding protein [Clostridia bacterium]